MIVLDTNVVSEAMRPAPDESVMQWLRRAEPRSGYITAITVGEILTGVGMLRAGRRRDELGRAANRIFEERSQRILAYDGRAARIFAHLRTERRRAGRPLGVEDGMIGAICIRERAALATRASGGFDGLGLTLIDPWQEG